MKKLITIMMMLGTMMFAIVAQAQVTYTATFSAEDLALESVSAADGNTYTKVTLSGIYGTIPEEGEPSLPTRQVNLMLPFGQTVDTIVLTNVVTTSFNVANHVFPAQTQSEGNEPFCSPKGSIYNSNAAYPVVPVKVSGQGYFALNNNILTLDVCPFEYHPLTKQLTLITSMTITVSFKNGYLGGVQQVSRLAKSQELYNNLLLSVVDNPQQINSYAIPSTTITEFGVNASGLPVYEYVIITPTAFADAFHDLVNWKRMKGINAGIVTMETISTTYQGDCIYPLHPIYDEAGKVRQYLYESAPLGTTWVLVAGDNVGLNAMPYRKETSTSLQIPTDLYYSDLTSDWYISNNVYGGSNISKWPDVFVGRLMCSSTQDIENWIGKLLIYEQNPGLGDPSYLKNSLCIQADQRQFYETAQDYMSRVPQYDFDLIEEYPNGEDWNPTYPYGYEVINQMNQKRYGLVNIFCHGGTGQYESGVTVLSRGYNVEQISKVEAEDAYDYPGLEETGNGLDNLTNYSKPSIIFTLSCKVNPFDITKSTYGKRNMGESFTVGGNYGGVAFLGNTRDNYGSYYQNFGDLLGSAENNPYLAHLGVWEGMSKYYSDYGNMFMHNLIGDPDCQIWTKVPNRLVIETEPHELDVEVSRSVDVRVKGFDNVDPNQVCCVTLFSEHDVYKVMDVPVNGLSEISVTFDSVFAMTPHHITATATCYNHIPAQCYIPVNDTCSINVWGTEEWTNDFTTPCDIIVNSGAKLTVKCNIGFNTINKVKVLPGGKLIMDGGSLNCAVPDHQWQGVRVLGTGSGSWQGMSQGQYTQGYFKMTNNAEIRNARVAVDLWDGIHFNTTGGIVEAKNAHFLNNGMAIRALYFQNTNPIKKHIHDYNARFYNCSFSTNQDYPIAGDVFHHHVVLARVKGVKFYGCGFFKPNYIDDLTAEDNAAIFAFDAGFMVDRYCSNQQILPCPDEDYVLSGFGGFNMGVNAINDGFSTSTFTIKNTRFSVNDYGVRTLLDAYPTILFSNFQIDGNNDCAIGVYLDRTSSFFIENNEFTRGPKEANTRFGTVVLNSESGNQIYLNNFHELTCANYSDGKNREAPSFSRRKGLEYECNFNSYNNFDFFIPYDTINLDNGIQDYQGAATKAAGNRFSDAEYQFYNGSNNPIRYYQYEGDNDQVLSRYYNVIPYSAPENECQPHYNNGGNVPVLPNVDRQQRENDYYNAYLNYNGIKTIYDSYIDGGNTVSELQNIASATPDDMWALRAKLLGDSPYLTDTTMRAASERKDVLTESVLFEILSANPEELGRGSLINDLESNSTLPDYMINLLRAIATNNTTSRSVLESQMSAYKRDYTLAASDIVRSILNDSIANPTALREWLGNMEDIQSDRQIIASYMEEGNDEAAFALANMLPSLYGLTGDALTEHNGYMQLLVLHDTLNNQDRTIFELTEQETALVNNLASNGVGIAKDMAQSILEANGSASNIQCPQIITHENRGSIKNGSQAIQQQINVILGLSVSANPNPATTWTTIDYALPDGAVKATLTLTNTLGVTVQTVELNGKQGQRVLDLRDLANGVYIYSVRCGSLLQTGKLVIAK